jgi:hypothetical protein
MEELLTAVRSESTQGANLTTLGRSASSAIPAHSNNHDSLQQKPQISNSSSLAQAMGAPNQVHPFKPDPVTPQVAAFDPASNSLFAVLSQPGGEERKSTDEVVASTSLLRVSAWPAHSAATEKKQPEWSHEPLDATRGNEISAILSNSEARTQGQTACEPHRASLCFDRSNEDLGDLAFSPTGKSYFLSSSCLALRQLSHHLRPLCPVSCSLKHLFQPREGAARCLEAFR